MRNLTVALFAVWFSCASGYGAEKPGSGATPPPPVAAFFAEPDFANVQISPGGQHLAFLSTLANGRVGIALMTLATGKVEPLVAAGDENIDFFFWKGDDRIVYGGDYEGNEFLALRSISISKRRVVVLAESYRERYADRANWAFLIDSLDADPDRILIGGNKEVGSYTTGIWKMNVATGKRDMVEMFGSGGDEVRSYEVDNAGRILGRTRFSQRKVIFEVRASPDERYATAAEFPEDEVLWNTVSFSGDNENLYVFAETAEGQSAVHTLNIRSRELSAPVFVAPEGELTGVVTSEDNKTLYGFTYMSDRTRYHWVDAKRAQLQKTIDSTLPGTENVIVSRTKDEKVLVVYAYSDRDPGTYYVLDLRAPRMTALGKVNRQLDPATMRPREPISFPARDGLTLHGYITRPAASEGQRVPLVVIPHGGPFGLRDGWGFDPEAQFLASRGYAVLHVNFRGSGGYGRKFMEAGKKEWGGKMQDDVTDGVKWAIAQGIADPDRIAIYGASYGGYAALMGAIKTPELYRCAANYVGVTDLAILTGGSNRDGGRTREIYYRNWIGDSKEYVFDRSPVNFVDRIQVPTLHAYGFNDPRVDIRHWERLEPKLKQYKKPYEAWVETKEGHGFYTAKSRIQFYERLENFFAKHLAPVRAPAGTPADKSE